MDNKLTDISVLSAYDIDVNLLLDFYSVVYQGLPIRNIWKWIYRAKFHDNKIPLVAVKGGRVIAHAGMIPFKVSINNKYYNASWFIDFAVLPDFQKYGVGTLLTKKWMEFSDIYVTFCNEKSIGVFKKYGWVESFETYLHRIFLRPFNHPKLIKRIPYFPRELMNSIFCGILKLIYRGFLLPSNGLRIQSLNEKSISEFMSGLKMPCDGVIPIRDRDYVSWRLLDSPDKSNYYIISYGDMRGIIKIFKKEQPFYIDLLWVSDPYNYSSMRNMISSVAIWGMDKGFTYLRYYVSERELAEYLRKYLKPIVNHPRFAFFSKNKELLEKLKKTNWHWSLIDSDFEAF